MAKKKKKREAQTAAPEQRNFQIISLVLIGIFFASLSVSGILSNLPAWFTAVSLTALIMIGVDKVQATRREWRVPEIQLFSLTIIGGAIGTMTGMVFFRHKIRRGDFWFLGMLMGAIHVGIFSYFS